MRAGLIGAGSIGVVRATAMARSADVRLATSTKSARDRTVSCCSCIGGGSDQCVGYRCGGKFHSASDARAVGVGSA
jgi:hypothetical protein